MRRGRLGPVAALAARALHEHAGEWFDGSLQVGGLGHGADLGDYRFVVPRSAGDPKSAARAAAAALTGIAPFVRVVAVPPQVYVTIDPAVATTTAANAVGAAGATYGDSDAGDGRTAYVSFSNPNLNKPLHVGHLRNNAIGMAVANLYAAGGYHVVRGQTLSDFGRHICQAALAYERWGGGATPESAGVKADHFVGQWYARYGGTDTDDAADETDGDVAGLLAATDAGKEDALALNALITGWAEEGITETYARIGSRFDTAYREAACRGVAVELVEDAATRGLFTTRPDGSVYVDLPGLGEVTMRRTDGSLVAYAQLLGISITRWRTCPFEVAVVVSGSQWKSGHQVIDAVLRLLGYDFPDRYRRIHYGMVRLPDGTMRSRTGNTVLVDDFLDDLERRLATRGATSAADLAKYYLLRRRIDKDVVFDDNELWDEVRPELERIRRALAVAEAGGVGGGTHESGADARVATLLIDAFPQVVERALADLDPSVLVRHSRDLAAAVSGPWLPPGHLLWPAVAVVLRRGLALLNVGER